MNRFRLLLRMLAALAVGAMLLAACGDDDDGEATAESPRIELGEITPVDDARSGDDGDIGDDGDDEITTAPLPEDDLPAGPPPADEASTSSVPFVMPDIEDVDVVDAPDEGAPPLVLPDDTSAEPNAERDDTSLPIGPPTSESDDSTETTTADEPATTGADDAADTDPEPRVKDDEPSGLARLIEEAKGR